MNSANGVPGHDAETRKVLFHVNCDDPARLNRVLDCIENIFNWYNGANKPVRIAVVADGPGLHMFSEDTSPVKERLKELAEAHEGIGFYACGDTRERIVKAGGKTPMLIAGVTIIRIGAVEIIELQRGGYTCLQP